MNWKEILICTANIPAEPSLPAIPCEGFSVLWSCPRTCQAHISNGTTMPKHYQILSLKFDVTTAKTKSSPTQSLHANLEFSFGQHIVIRASPNCLTCGVHKKMQNRQQWLQECCLEQLSSNESRFSVLSHSELTSHANTWKVRISSPPWSLSGKVEVSISSICRQRHLPGLPRAMDLRFVWKLPHCSSSTCKWSLPVFSALFFSLGWSNWWRSGPFGCKRSCWRPTIKVQPPSQKGCWLHPWQSVLFRRAMVKCELW